MPTRPPLRTTHTVSTLEVSPAAYDEIAAKLRAADYAHVFEDDKPGAMMDMTGIGITRVPTLICKTCVKEYPLEGTPHVCTGLAPKPVDVDAMMSRLSFVMHERKARNNYLVMVGFMDLESAQEFHQWCAERSSKATKAGA